MTTLVVIVMLAVLGMACGDQAPLPPSPPVADTATTSPASSSGSESIDTRPLYADSEAQDGSNKAHRGVGVEGSDTSSALDGSLLGSTSPEEPDSTSSQPINPAEVPDDETEQRDPAEPDSTSSQPINPAEVPDDETEQRDPDMDDRVSAPTIDSSDTTSDDNETADGAAPTGEPQRNRLLVQRCVEVHGGGQVCAWG